MNRTLYERYNILNEKTGSKPMICVRFGCKDRVTLSRTKEVAIGVFDGFDKGCLLLSSGIKIPLIDIISIEGDIFRK